MKEKFINNYVNLIIKNNSNISTEELEKIKYGIEGIYLTITKLIIVIILGLIFKILPEIIIVLFFYNILRFFGFGYHAKTSTECLIFSIIFFVGLPFLVTNNFIIIKYQYLLFIVCILNFFLFAPSDTKKRPMINIKKKRKRKILIIMTSFLYLFISLFSNYKISSLILLSIVIESIMVNPVIYLITKEPYNNYKNYLN